MALGFEYIYIFNDDGELILDVLGYVFYGVFHEQLFERSIPYHILVYVSLRDDVLQIHSLSYQGLLELGNHQNKKGIENHHFPFDKRLYLDDLL